MSDIIPVSFESPQWLVMLLIIIPAFLMAHRSIGGISRRKAYTTFAVRAVVIVLLTVVLTNPSWVKRGEGVTVTVLVDRSESIPAPIKASSLRAIQAATGLDERPEDEDQVAVIAIARDAAISAMPDTQSLVEVVHDVADATATNLAHGVSTALAIMPDDTANRILLASDGNETMDSVLQAAELAKANNVPIDVLVLEYDHPNEIIFDRIIAPARSRRGQSANIKLVLRSQAEATGTVYLDMEEQRLDMNGDEPGDGMRVALTPGVNVIPVTLSLDNSGRAQFDASFVPDDNQADFITDNNNATAVTFVSGEGQVLIIDNDEQETALLRAALEGSDIHVRRILPSGLTNLALLSGFDAVVLANVARHEFDDTQDRMLHSYVHDMGGGLIMLGGPDSFGAGQWNDSEVSKVLPVKLDPPQSRKMPRGALALIMHSCEMPQGNFWGQKTAESAIKALSRLDYIGILEYDWNGGGNGASWVFPLQEAGDKSAAMAAVKKLVLGDMQDFGGAMQLAVNGLAAVRAGQKHLIIISDGDPAPPSNTLLAQYVSNNITVTTIMVGGHGTLIDRTRMQAVAQATGGRFYNVTNPKKLPSIFIKEAQLVSRSLIQEGTFTPQRGSSLPGPTEGFAAFPDVEGYVLTAPREGLSHTPVVINTEEGSDPLFASWNFGLGRSVAFTSDATGRWGAHWASWSDYKDFWEQTMRWTMRPSSPRNMQVSTRRDGDLAIIEVEALEDDTSFLNFLTMEARVIDPRGEARDVTLQQTAPGRYFAQFKTADSGAYLVNVSYANPDRSEIGHLQAAVTVPYAEEFRATRHNRALLEELALKTGGRIIEPNATDGNELFDRTQLEVPRSPKAIWDLLLIIAACLFVFDVASRRIAIDPKWFARVVRRGAQKRADASTNTVAAWKRTKQRVDDDRTEKEKRSKPSKRSKESDIDSSARFEASEDGSDVSFDVGADTPTDSRGGAAKPKSPLTSSSDDNDDDDGDTMSRLLEARRRAREEERGRSDDGGGDA